MSDFVVSARKYRPGNFKDVVGQPAITATLRNAIKNNHLGHAYLFSGPRGVGKTTCARIFAKTINCFHITDEGEACNTCESCQSFNENRSYNIHELDAASNNSVDDIRMLTEQVRIPPQVGSYSIYIIDEVHMLSQAAFNAFLKTLEEPPGHAVFILATTEKHKIIPTILSRCQIYDFNRIRIDDTMGYLKTIADQEKVEVEEDALHVIAQKADGAMRDALSIFDQVVSFSGRKITYKEVIENLNILDYEYYFSLTKACLENDVSSALVLFNEILERGFDARNFINGFASHLRDLMVSKDRATLQLLEVGATIRKRYEEQSAEVSLPFLYEGLEICNQADIQFRTSRNQRLTIELSLVKLANLTAVQKKKVTPNQHEPEEVPEIRQSSKGKEEPSSGEQKPAPKIPDSNGNIVLKKPRISIKDSLRENEAGAAEPEAGNEETETFEGNTPEDKVPDAETALTQESVIAGWNNYAKSIEKKYPRVFSTLSSNKPLLREDGSIRVSLNSQAQCDYFVQKIRKPLLEFLIRETGNKTLLIEATLQESESSGQKLYTDQDRLDYLMKKNPALRKLKTTFNLDFDD